ncbi:hypothetical protein Glove_606g49 [Diversispora epigaea]|uniref:Uncharacterized protein n=1 Tax=Diversispora epigaea TaxID=1348612 RepID=A0A397G9Y8_9GLOM|nr:hypothetical protein Glove_606g49 [Diversispora epigaea]
MSGNVGQGLQKILKVTRDNDPQGKQKGIDGTSFRVFYRTFNREYIRAKDKVGDTQIDREICG